MDKKKLSTTLKISAIWLAVLSLFMCFGAAISIKDSGTSGGIGLSVFDYMFAKGEALDYLKDEGAQLHNGGLIVAFVFLLLAIIALVTLLILNSKQKLNKTAKISIAAVAAAMLLVSAILFFCTKVFIDKLDEEWLQLGEYAKLGAGAICAGIFSLFAAGCTLGGYLIKENPELIVENTH